MTRAWILGVTCAVSCGYPALPDLTSDAGPPDVATGMCGDGVVDTAGGIEQCDHGLQNGEEGDGCTSTCTFACSMPAADCGAAPKCQSWTCGQSHTCIAVADVSLNDLSCGTEQECHNGACVSLRCGNNNRDVGEQCDDGNNRNLDGCSAGCRFEQNLRANSLSLSFTHDTYCAKDALGEAIVGTSVRDAITSSISGGIADGSLTIMFAALGLDDLGGTNEPAFLLGILGGNPQTGTVAYNGASDLEWWYTADPASIDAARVPKSQLPATIVSGVMNAGKQEIVVAINIAGSVVMMDMFDTKLRATTGSSTPPTSSATGMTPGHLATEHLDPGLSSFGTVNGGVLCGRTTAGSLANAPVPPSLLGAGCSEGFTATNRLLDLVVAGCTSATLGQLVKPTQPDVSRDGAIYAFQQNAAHIVTGCTRNGAAEVLSTCLTSAGYGTMFKLTLDRVIVK